MYVELHAASAFSFLEGASLPETLVDRAVALGYPALALLDRDGVSGLPRFHMAAKKAGLRAIVGAELTIRTGSAEPGAGARAAWSPRPPTLWRLPVLVASREGYRNLCRLVTRMKLRAPKGEGALAIEEFDGHTAGLVALVGRAALDASLYGVGGLLDRVVGLFGRDDVRVEIQRHLRRDEESDNQALRALASAFHVPVMATNGVRFAAEDERPLFDVLTCIRHGTTIARAGRRLSWNAERFLKPATAMARLFEDLPEALAASVALAERLQFTMADLGYRFPDYPVAAGESQASFLRKIAEVGARERYRPYHDRARLQIARELDLIEKLDLAGYFLIVWDLVNYCRQHGILVQGRGSAANSAVCYSLGITAVDPIGMELLFERFLSEERGEWPDIDLDLPSGDRREQVIQYVYERYGRLGAAMTANVITYRGRSAAREVGKVLDMEADTIDRLAKAMAPFEWQDPAETLKRHLDDAGLDAGDARVVTFAGLWRRIQDLPRHLGQHSGGMVICQGRLDEVVPLEPASMPGRVVVQWDKEDCADMGIVKVDLLGLGMMAVLQDTLAEINGKATGYGLRTTGAGGEDEQAHEGRLTAGGSPRAAGGGGERAGDWRLAADGGDAPNLELGTNVEHRTASNPERGTRHSALGTDTPLDLSYLPPDDPVVYGMLRAADTIGVFQVESRAQMATLPRLKPERFYDLVVEVAIIRPGPIVGHMVHPYLARRNGRETVSYPHPALEPVLKRTLGVPLFQEQLLRMAMVVAGFTGGEAEELRRAMGFKRSEARMRQIETKLRAGMARNGITGAAADGIVQSIVSFALYGFPESHAASFALLVYASAYFKAHYPAAFYAALLNNQPMGFYHPATLVKDAQRRGVRFASIDVQASGWDCHVQPDGAIRLGLRYVRGLREDVGRRIGAGGGTRAAEVTFRKADGGSDASRRGVGPFNPESRPGPTDQFPAMPQARGTMVCPKCGADDPTLLERVETNGDGERWFCSICAHDWAPSASRPGRDCEPAGAGCDARSQPRRGREPAVGEAVDAAPRFRNLAHLVAVTGAHRDELATLAEIGALNAFGYDRRSALWQIERAVRPAGALFDESGEPGTAEVVDAGHGAPVPAVPARQAQGRQDEASGAKERPGTRPRVRRTDTDRARAVSPSEGRTTNRDQAPVSPLSPMTPFERVVADYDGTGLTIGPHPMALRRADLALRGVLRAIDLPRARAGRRVRVAGAVITRQRPGTAKGFVFLTLEDETGVANVIVRPDVFADQRVVIVREPFVVVEGVLQQQDGVTSVRAEQVVALGGRGPAVDSHDFH